MSTKVIDLKTSNEGLVISGKSFGEVDENHRPVWNASYLDKHRVILTKDRDREPKISEGSNVLCGTPSIFMYQLLGLVDCKFSGLITVDTERGVKKLYLDKGQLRFAGSNLMDDRLGEIIYRRNLINIDQLISCASQVTRIRKFGQALIEDGIFDANDLWNALIMQVKDIFRSVFMVNYLVFQIKEGDVAPFSLEIDQSTESLAYEADAWSAAFKEFLLTLSVEAEFDVVEEVANENFIKEGSFQHDILELVKSHKVLGSILKASKLKDINTLYELFESANQNLIRIKAPNQSALHVDPVKGDLDERIQQYNAIISLIGDAFALSNRAFPVDKLTKYLKSMGGIARLMCLAANGLIVPHAEAGLRAVWRGSQQNQSEVTKLMDRLILFVSQIFPDMLPFEVAGTVRAKLVELRKR